MVDLHTSITWIRLTVVPFFLRKLRWNSLVDQEQISFVLEIIFNTLAIIGSESEQKWIFFTFFFQLYRFISMLRFENLCQRWICFIYVNTSQTPAVYELNRQKMRKMASESNLSIRKTAFYLLVKDLLFDRTGIGKLQLLPVPAKNPWGNIDRRCKR